MIPYGLTDIHSIAVDPTNPNEIVVQYVSGWLDVSYNAGATWTGFDQSYTWQSTDIPWMADIVSPGGYLGSGDIVFNPANPGAIDCDCRPWCYYHADRDPADFK